MSNNLFANYKVIKNTPERIVLVDLGPWDQYATVTNAAENVVAEIEGIYSIGSRRVFYYDSEGELTELLVKDGKFAGFKYAAAEDKGSESTH